MQKDDVLLRMEGICKSFPGVKALDDAQLTVRPGTVHALMGENGAGKSTLMKCLFGIYSKDAGTIWFDGKEVNFKSSRDALDNGVAMVHQELNQALKRSVMDNIWLGRYPRIKLGGAKMPFVSDKAEYDMTMEVFKDLNFEKFGININPRTIMSTMPVSRRQMVEIAKAVSFNSKIIVLDEPTANLDADAIDTLRQQIIQIKKEGRTVVIAEHRLYFLMDLIDRAIFIQKGKIVQIFSGNEFRNLSDEQRIRMGLRSLVHPVLELPPADPSGAQEGLSVENLSCAFDKQPVFSGLGFSAKRGEVLGIVGHNGAGKTTMTHCLCGLLKEVNGTVRLDGQTLKAKQRNKASFCVMQDVNHQLFSDSVWNECELAQPDCPPERIEEILRSFDLLDFKDRHPMALSGGQKQRLAVATAILSNKDVLVFDEPTSGLDYHRMLEVSNMIRKLNDENKIIIIVSHDFEFLGRTCDKIFDMEGCSKERR